MQAVITAISKLCHVSEQMLTFGHVSTDDNMESNKENTSHDTLNRVTTKPVRADDCGVISWPTVKSVRSELSTTMSVSHRHVKFITLHLQRLQQLRAEKMDMHAQRKQKT